MCGIAGFWGPPRPADFFPPILEGMCACLRHRGPDSSGIWFDPAAGLGLAHTRLAILDLSDEGAQPMRRGKPDAPQGASVLAFLAVSSCTFSSSPAPQRRPPESGGGAFLGDGFEAGEKLTATRRGESP